MFDQKRDLFLFPGLVSLFSVLFSQKRIFFILIFYHDLVRNFYTFYTNVPIFLVAKFWFKIEQNKIIVRFNEADFKVSRKYLFIIIFTPVFVKNKFAKSQISR